ncbi:MAG: hypothetical protein R3F30_11655 [Planctomycetota bacterium]
MMLGTAFSLGLALLQGPPPEAQGPASRKAAVEFPRLWPSPPIFAIGLASPARLARDWDKTRVMEWFESADMAEARLFLERVREGSRAALGQDLRELRAVFEAWWSSPDCRLEMAFGAKKSEKLVSGTFLESGPWAALRVQGLPEAACRDLRGWCTDFLQDLAEVGAEDRPWRRSSGWSRAIRLPIEEFEIEVELGVSIGEHDLEVFVAGDLACFDAEGPIGRRLAADWSAAPCAFCYDFNSLIQMCFGMLRFRAELQGGLKWEQNILLRNSRTGCVRWSGCRPSSPSC